MQKSFYFKNKQKKISQFVFKVQIFYCTVNFISTFFIYFDKFNLSSYSLYTILYEQWKLNIL